MHFCKKVPQEDGTLPGHETKALLVDTPLVSPPIIGDAVLKIYSSSYQGYALMLRVFVRVVPSLLNKTEGNLAYETSKILDPKAL